MHFYAKVASILEVATAKGQATMKLNSSIEQRGTALGAILGIALLALPSPAALAQNQQHTLPLVLPDGSTNQGFVRIINRSDSAGTVTIHAIDDNSERFGPITFNLAANATKHFNSEDLEQGNADKGLSSGLGNGEGDWRLELATELDIEPLAYIRTSDGFLASVHDVVRTVEVGGETVHRVPIFNPGSNRNQVSSLRLVNLTDSGVDVTIRGRDDAGQPAPGGGGAVRLALPANGARRISAQQLESGAAGFAGRFGNGTGKWELFVTADGAIEVMSLMQTPTGHLTDLSVSGLRRTEASEAPLPNPVGSTIRDCAECPEMVVVPAGSYPMGSPADERDRDADEGPVHRVTIDEPFAVGRYEVTFAQWDACHGAGGCSHRPDDQGRGRGNRPVLGVSWDDAQEYARWLSGRTGWSYRLLSESEWEYAARARTTTRYWWGDDIGRNRANCDGCGSRWDARQTAPVGSFSANPFGLHDVHGNVYEWVEDCRNPSYVGAPDDGSAWTSGDCDWRMRRGGSWDSGSLPRYLRSANRAAASPPSGRSHNGVLLAGIRVARTLAAPARHALALFRPAGQDQQGFARIINRSNRAGTVHVYGTDDAGQRRGPVTLSLNAKSTRHFNSNDLEEGNTAKGLSAGLGDGAGNWRLELVTDLDIEPSAYIRTSDGFLTAMHAVVVGTDTDHRVPTFNPGSNRNQASWLRLVNLTGEHVTVTIEGRDDAGRPAPQGKVYVGLPARGAKQLSAQQLEAGDTGFRGRMGVGKGKWQLFVTSDGAIEVVSLLQSRTGHLSNLSTTPRGAGDMAAGFEVVAEGPSTVRPLQTIQLAVPEGLAESHYQVLMDLSGTGAFDEDDTIEVDGITTDEDKILFASPLTQILSDENTSRAFAVRVRRAADRQVSNVLDFFVEDLTIPAQSSGYPTTALEVVLKSLYLSVDDPLLNLGAPSIQPGLSVESAWRLDLDTALPDVQAEAMLQSLLGVSVAEWVASNRPRSAAADAPDTPFAVTGSAYSSDNGLAARDLPWQCSVARRVCEVFQEKLQCLGRAITAFGGSREVDADHCADARFGLEIGEAFEESTAKIATWLTAGRQFGGRLVRKLIDRKAIERLWISNTMLKPLSDASKTLRVLAEGESDISARVRDLVQDGSGLLKTTKRGARKIYENLRSLNQDLTEDTPELISEAERDFGSRSRDDDEREAFWSNVHESDRLRREADGIDDLEGVYTGETAPLDAIGDNPGVGVAVANACASGYEEFPIDGETSTCVFRSLVEPNCYAGSRRVRDPDLGGADVCLYYSLDFFQPNGTCRQNYDRVYFQERWTCRWDELEAHEPAWYTLHETQDDELLPPPGEVPPGVASCFARLGYSHQSFYDGPGPGTAVTLCYAANCSFGFINERPQECSCCETLDDHLLRNPYREVALDRFLFECSPDPNQPFLSIQGVVSHAARLPINTPADRNECRMTVDDKRAECRRILDTQLLPEIDRFAPLFDSCRAAFDAQVRSCEAHFDSERSKCGS